MKNKGFTLVELIALIIVLSVIMVLSFSTLTRMMKNAETKELEDFKEEIINAATVYVETNLDKFPNLNTDARSENINAKILVELGYLDKNIENPTDSKLDEITIKVVKKEDNTIEYEVILNEKYYVCKRATKLHEEECTQTDEEYYCSGAGYTKTGSKGTTTIKYGNEDTINDVLNSGDAFDCDVNGDGVYDSESERFYYVSDYYNTTTKEFEDDKAVLIYYSNTYKGIATYEGGNEEAYNYDYLTINGPKIAIGYLPSREQWINISLIDSTRAIIGVNGENSTETGMLPTAFDYSRYSARLLTTQELQVGCNNLTIGTFTKYELESCTYLLEKSSFSIFEDIEGIIPCDSGFWLENPLVRLDSNGSVNAWGVSAKTSNVDYYIAEDPYQYGVRPVIELYKNQIDY